MTSQVSFHRGLGSCFVRLHFCRGNKIAYCSANSITPESPYHFLHSGSSEREAPRYRDHHQRTVAGEFEIKGGVLLGEAGWRRSNWIVCCLLLFLLLTGCAAVMESSYFMVKECSFSLFLFTSSVSSFPLPSSLPPVFSSTHSPCQSDNLTLSLTLTLSPFLLQRLHLFCRPTITFSISHFFPPSFSLLQTEQFVHTLKDELVKSALLALHAARPGYVSKTQRQTPVQGGQNQGHIHQGSDQNQSPVQGLPGHSPTTSVTESPAMCNNVEGSQTTTKGEGGTLPPKHQDSIPHHKEYDEEEWVSETTF